MPLWKAILTINIRLEGHVLAEGFDLSRRPVRLGSVGISKLKDSYNIKQFVWDCGVDARRA